MSRLNVWPWLRPFIILVLVVSLPPLLYWFGYVNHSVQAAKQQAYVTLSAVATNFKDRLAAHDRIAVTAENMASVEPHRLKPYLESVLQAKSASAVPTAASHLDVGKTSGGLFLNVGRIPADAPEAKVRANARQPAEPIRCGASHCSMRAVVALETMIPWNVVEAEFDGLLVLSEDGRLLAQDRRLPTQSLGAVVPLHPGSSPEVGGKAAAEKGSTARPSLRSPTDFSDQASIELAGIEYIAFTQQVLVPVTPVDAGGSADAPPAPTTLTFTVCALIAKEQLRSQSLGLSPQTLISIGAMVAFGLFSIPFLKLRFIGARERLHPRDIWLLASSLLCATALMVLVILDGHTLVNLRERFDAGLFKFSQSVRANLDWESKEAVSQLRASARELLEAEPVGMAQGAVLASARNFDYPDFEAAFITDLKGFQAHKWMPRTIPTPSIGIQHESYFPETLALTQGAPGRTQYMYSSIIAPTSGLPLGVFALPLDEHRLQMGRDIPPERRSGIIVMATPMRTVNFPIVAEPFQFVLLNRSGEVTFQQAQGPFRGERFFDSVQGGQALELAGRAAARSGLPTAGTYQYRGRSYRMSAMDIPNLQATLVVYYDHAVVGALAARVFGTSVLFMLGIVISMLAGAALAVCWFGKAALDWAWPTPSRAQLYVLGSLVCIGTMLFLLLMRFVLTPNWLTWFLICAPAFVLVVLGSGRVVGWMQRLANKLPCNMDAAAQRSRRLTSLAFQSFAVMAMLAFIAWPASIVYNDAFTLHAAAFARGVEKNWNMAQAKWFGRLQGPVANVGEPLPSQDCAVLPADLRCTVPDRLYASQPNYARLVKVRTEKGVYNTCANLRVLKGDCITNGTAEAAPESFTLGVAKRLAQFGHANTTLLETLQGFSNEQEKTAKHVPLLEGFEWSRWNLGGFSLLIGAMSLLVGSISKHVLGVGLTHDVVLDEHDLFKRGDGTRWVLLRPSSSMLAHVVGPDTILVDLRDMQLTPDLKQPAEGKTLCVLHVERRLSDPAWRDALLSLLNTRTPGCIVITSDIDPLYYLTQRSREKEDSLRSLGHEDSERRKEAEEDSRNLRDELAHWGVALSEVRKIRQAPAPFPEIPVAAARRHLRDKLVEECANIDFLVDIGARLLRRPDLEAYRWEEIVGFILDAAEPFYRSLWELCSREERLVLIQLAQEGLVNPRRVELVRRLARRGLVLFDPRVRLMNESFQRFARTVETPERIAEWERTTEGMSWSRLGTPLYALAAVIIAILLFTEQAMFTSVLAIATGAATTLGSLRNLYAAAKPVVSPSKAA